MTTKQGDLALLNDPVAQDLLHNAPMGRLAYVWKDGSPRVTPMGFHWDGSQIVMGTTTYAPKFKVIDNRKVAFTIDTTSYPWKVLYIRGTAHVTVTGSIPNEYRLGTRKVLGDEAGEAFLKQADGMKLTWTRVGITPEWVGILDFETRFPDQLVRGMSGG